MRSLLNVCDSKRNERFLAVYSQVNVRFGDIIMMMLVEREPHTRNFTYLQLVTSTIGIDYITCEWLGRASCNN